MSDAPGRILDGSCYRTKFILDTDYVACHNHWFGCEHINEDPATKTIVDNWAKHGWGYKDCANWPECNAILENESIVISTPDNPIKYFNPSEYKLCGDDSCNPFFAWEPANFMSDKKLWDLGESYPEIPIPGECVDTDWWCSGPDSDSGYTPGQGACIEDPRVALNCPKTCNTCT
jgi:hypothetical protein